MRGSQGLDSFRNLANSSLLSLLYHTIQDLSGCGADQSGLDPPMSLINQENAHGQAHGPSDTFPPRLGFLLPNDSRLWQADKK